MCDSCVCACVVCAARTNVMYTISHWDNKMCYIRRRMVSTWKVWSIQFIFAATLFIPIPQCERQPLRAQPNSPAIMDTGCIDPWRHCSSQMTFPGLFTRIASHMENINSFPVYIALIHIKMAWFYSAIVYRQYLMGFVWMCVNLPNNASAGSFRKSIVSLSIDLTRPSTYT